MVVVTENNIRGVTGLDEQVLPSSVITNTIIPQVEAKTYSYFNVQPTPTKKLEILDGNNKDTIQTHNPLLLKLLELRVGDNDIDIKDVQFNMYSGIVRISRNQTPLYFYQRERNVKIKYLSGLMEKNTNIVTELMQPLNIGDDVTIEVEDSTNFNINDWVLLEGLNGSIETSKITNISSNDITFDSITQEFEEGAILTKIDTHRLLKDFILFECGVYASTYAIGKSYTFNTGFSKDGASFQKGVPYTHFDRNLNALIQQRDLVKQQLFNLIGGMS